MYFYPAKQQRMQIFTWTWAGLYPLAYLLLVLPAQLLKMGKISNCLK
jgi:hypothetical protein